MAVAAKFLVSLLVLAIVLSLTLGQSTTTAAYVGPILLIFFLTGLFAMLLRGARSGHGPAKTRKGLVRYQPKRLGKDALLGVALGEIIHAVGAGVGVAVVASAAVAVTYRLGSPSFASLPGSTWRGAIDAVVGLAAAAAAINEVLNGECFDADDSWIVLLAVAVSTAVMLAVSLAVNRRIRMGTTIGHMRLSDVPLVAFLVIELVVLAASDGGIDLIGEQPVRLILGAAALVGLAFAAGPAIQLVYGLFGIGLAIVKAYFALLEEAVISGPGEPIACFGGWTVVAATLTFMLVSGLRLGQG